ncbi:MAG: PAS domain-containing sensor histidine kinase [Leptothrix ochracea]|uniref:sensor histidine kinase n=1 Tax=Leptothrix ochracea TaxID=735331 RepID=UPI0034E1B102
MHLFGIFALARVLLGLLLLLVEVLLELYAHTGISILAWGLCSAYVAAAVGLLRWQRRTSTTYPHTAPIPPKHWWLWTVGVDLLAFTFLLQVVGTGQNIAAMFAMPVLMAAMLARRRTAMAVAAAVTLILLGSAWIEWMHSGGVAAVLFTQAGVTGSGLFLVAMLTGDLASRLARQEQATRSSIGLARQQVALNRLMIDEIPEGVMVIDQQGLVRAGNPAALGLLADKDSPLPSPPFLLPRIAEARGLWQAVEDGFRSGVWPSSGRDVALGQAAIGSAEGRTVRVRMRMTRDHGMEAGQVLGVVFLEDLRAIQARVRQERLAAMGRVSTGIAHEIRNPLAAIAQANALLHEDVPPGPQQRLTQIVSDNVERLRRTVDDIMEVAPGRMQAVMPIDLRTQVQSACLEWSRIHALPDDIDLNPLSVEIGMDRSVHEWAVRFDPDHLHRVLVNLLDNALRHSTRRRGAIAVTLDWLPGKAELCVANDGLPVEPEVEPYLFEPFFSTRSRGMGLGLYICRELCERYGATIEYRAAEPGARRHNQFLITWPCEPALLSANESAEPPSPRL